MSSELASNANKNENTIKCSTNKLQSNESMIGSTVVPTVNQSSNSHNKSNSSPIKSNTSRFSALARIFKPWKWKRKKKSEKFEKTSKGFHFFPLFQLTFSYFNSISLMT
jgi:phosphatase and actin regulator 4